MAANKEIFQADHRNKGDRVKLKIKLLRDQTKDHQGKPFCWKENIKEIRLDGVLPTDWIEINGNRFSVELLTLKPGVLEGLSDIYNEGKCKSLKAGMVENENNI